MGPSTAIIGCARDLFLLPEPKLAFRTLVMFLPADLFQNCLPICLALVMLTLVMMMVVMMRGVLLPCTGDGHIAASSPPDHGVGLFVVCRKPFKLSCSCRLSLSHTSYHITSDHTHTSYCSTSYRIIGAGTSGASRSCQVVELGALYGSIPGTYLYQLY